MRTACTAMNGTIYLRISSKFGFLSGSSLKGKFVSFDLLRFGKAHAHYMTQETTVSLQKFCSFATWTHTSRRHHLEGRII